MSTWECLWSFGCRVDHRRHGGTNRDHTGGQQDDDQHDDQHHDDDGHNQLDVFPPVGAGHLLRRLLEVLRLHRHRSGHVTLLRRTASYWHSHCSKGAEMAGSGTFQHVCVCQSTQPDLPGLQTLALI